MIICGLNPKRSPGQLLPNARDAVSNIHWVFKSPTSIGILDGGQRYRHKSARGVFITTISCILTLCHCRCKMGTEVQVGTMTCWNLDEMSKGWVKSNQNKPSQPIVKEDADANTKVRGDRDSVMNLVRQTRSLTRRRCR